MIHHFLYSNIKPHAMHGRPEERVLLPKASVIGTNGLDIHEVQSCHPSPIEKGKNPLQGFNSSTHPLKGWL